MAQPPSSKLRSFAGATAMEPGVLLSGRLGVSRQPNYHMQALGACQQENSDIKTQLLWCFIRFLGRALSPSKPLLLRHPQRLTVRAIARTGQRSPRFLDTLWARSGEPARFLARGADDHSEPHLEAGLTDRLGFYVGQTAIPIAATLAGHWTSPLDKEERILPLDQEVYGLNQAVTRL